jgi:hypothetical protein
VPDGEVPEWLKGTDCKSVGFAYAGSNPALSTIFNDLQTQFADIRNVAAIFTHRDSRIASNEALNLDIVRSLIMDGGPL